MKTLGMPPRQMLMALENQSTIKSISPLECDNKQDIEKAVHCAHASLGLLCTTCNRA